MYCLRCVLCREVEWFPYGQTGDQALMHCKECGGQMGSAEEEGGPPDTPEQKLWEPDPHDLLPPWSPKEAARNE